MLVVTLPTSNLFIAVPMHMTIFLAIRTLDDSGFPFYSSTMYLWLYILNLLFIAFCRLCLLLKSTFTITMNLLSVFLLKSSHCALGKLSWISPSVRSSHMCLTTPHVLFSPGMLMHLFPPKSSRVQPFPQLALLVHLRLQRGLLVTLQCF